MQSDYFPQEKLSKLLTWVHESAHPIYKAVLTAEQVAAPVTKERWEQLPFVAKAELRSVGFWDRFTAAKPDHIRHTYGTTSKRVLVSPRVHHASYETFFADTEVTCLMTFFATANFDFPRLQLGIQQVQGDSGKIEESAAIARRMGVDALFLTPYSAMKLADFLVADGSHLKLKAISLGGEITSGKQLEQLKKLYPNAELYQTYSSSEMGEVTAITCAHDRKTEHCIRVAAHPDMYVELIAKDGTVIDTEGQIGEIVVTTLGEVPMPLLRYRTGDLASYSKRSCSCEQEARGFIIYGRDNTAPIRIGRGEVSLEAVSQALEKTGLTDYSYFDVVVGESKKGELALSDIEVILYAKEQRDEASPETVAQFAETLEVYPGSSYQAGVRDGYYMPLKIRWDFDQHNPLNTKGPQSKMVRR